MSLIDLRPEKSNPTPNVPLKDTMSTPTTTANGNSATSPPTSNSAEAPSPRIYTRNNGNVTDIQSTSLLHYSTENPGATREHENLARTAYRLADAIYQNASEADLEQYGTAEERCQLLGIFAYQLMEVANINRVVSYLFLNQ